MADDWTKVETKDEDQKKAWGTKEWEENKRLVGVLVEMREKVGPNESKIWVIEEPDGTKVEIWGTNVLDSRLNSIPQGSEIKIEYGGMKKNPGTGRNYKAYEVFRRS